MYPISNAVKALFDAEQKQVLRITGVDSNGTTISITDANVLINGFNIDRYSCNGQKLEIGTAIASQLELKLNNADGTYDSIIFEGSELFVEIGIADWSQQTPTITYIPCGYFTPDEQPRKLSTISLKALDRMTRFDAVPPTLTPWTDGSGNVITDGNGNIIYFCAGLVFPATVEELIKQCCSRCSVPFTQDISSLPNYNYQISALPALQQEITFRNIIQWCAGLMGTNAWIDWEGKLRFSWYDNATGYTMTTANRYSSDLYENAIVISGVQFTDTDEDKTVYLAGVDTYTIDLTGNPFVTASSASTILTNIYNVVHNFAYTPFEAAVVQAPYLWPMDRVTYTDKDGNGHVSLLSNVNFGLNSNTMLAGRGMTATINQSADLAPFTQQQAQALQQIQRVNSTALNDAVEHAAQMITGGLGGYVILKVNEETGQTEEILIMDTPDTTTAVNVWRFNQGGLGHSSNGYAGPYTLAMTQNGAIVADFITSGILNADVIRAGMIADSSGENYWRLDGNNSEFVTNKGTIGNFNIDNGDLQWGSQAVGGTFAYVGKDGISYGATQNDVVEWPNNMIKTQMYYQGIKFFWDNTLRTTLYIYNGGLYVRCHDENGVETYPLQIFDRNNVQTIHLRYMVFAWENFYIYGEVSIRNNAEVQGDFSVTGTKNRRVHSEDYGDRLLYCYETPSPMFGDVGEGVIGEDGRCYVWLDPIFAQTIATDQYQVFLQQYGNGECWVAERRAACFIVEGTPGLAFGWEIKAKQKDFDQRRLDTPIETPEKNKNDYAAMAQAHIDQIHEGRISA